MDFKSFTQAIREIADEKGIPRERILEAIEMAIAAAYKRDYGKKGQIIRAELDPESGKISLTQIKIVVDESMVKSEEEVRREEEARGNRAAELGAEEELVRPKPAPREEPRALESEEGEGKKVRFNPEKHLMLEEARKINPAVEAGTELAFPLPYREEYGRIAAQTAKQVIIQRIREIEREAVFAEYKSKEGEVVSGIVQRVEGRNVFLDIGRTVGILPPEEQIPGEHYRAGERVKALIILVERSARGPGIFLSRSHPRLLKKLFEVEVPELAAGTVEMKSVAREAGYRSKVAVTSHEESVDPVGSLVGQKGIRVTTVIQELGGEKIDVIEWAEDPAEFIAHALSPAHVVEVLLDEKKRQAAAIVPEEQLSLAIGKGGQNVRLAAKLTGWKIDVRSATMAKAAREAPESAAPGGSSDQSAHAGGEEAAAEVVPPEPAPVDGSAGVSTGGLDRPEELTTAEGLSRTSSPPDEKPKRRSARNPRNLHKRNVTHGT